MYSRRQYKVSLPLKKTRCPTAYQRLKNVTVYHFYGVYTLTIFTRHFPSNSAQNSSIERAKVIGELEGNWRGEKRLIDKKSINNRRTEAERSTRRAETIDGLKRNGRLEQQKQSTD